MIKQIYCGRTKIFFFAGKQWREGEEKEDNEEKEKVKDKEKRGGGGGGEGEESSSSNSILVKDFRRQRKSKNSCQILPQRGESSSLSTVPRLPNQSLFQICRGAKKQINKDIPRQDSKK